MATPVDFRSLSLGYTSKSALLYALAGIGNAGKFGYAIEDDVMTVAANVAGTVKSITNTEVELADLLTLVAAAQSTADEAVSLAGQAQATAERAMTAAEGLQWNPEDSYAKFRLVSFVENVGETFFIWYAVSKQDDNEFHEPAPEEDEWWWVFPRLPGVVEFVLGIATAAESTAIDAQETASAAAISSDFNRARIDAPEWVSDNDPGYAKYDIVFFNPGIPGNLYYAVSKQDENLDHDPADDGQTEDDYWWKFSTLPLAIEFVLGQIDIVEALTVAAQETADEAETKAGFALNRVAGQVWDDETPWDYLAIVYFNSGVTGNFWYAVSKINYNANHSPQAFGPDPYWWVFQNLPSALEFVLKRVANRVSSAGSVTPPFGETFSYITIGGGTSNPALFSKFSFAFLDEESCSGDLWISNEFAVPENGVWLRYNLGDDNNLGVFFTEENAQNGTNIQAVLANPDATHDIPTPLESNAIPGETYGEIVPRAGDHFPSEIIFAPRVNNNFIIPNTTLPGTRWEIDFVVDTEWSDMDVPTFVANVWVNGGSVLDISSYPLPSEFTGKVMGKLSVEYINSFQEETLFQRFRVSLLVNGISSDGDVWTCAQVQDGVAPENYPNGYFHLGLGMQEHTTPPVKWNFVSTSGKKIPPLPED